MNDNYYYQSKESMKKPNGFKSKGLSQNDISVDFINDPIEVIGIKAWDGAVRLSPTETVKLYEWLKKSVPYIKKQYLKQKVK